MDFQKLQLQVGHALSRDEIQALAFLCTDLLGVDLSSVKSASDLFSHLADQDLLSAERPYLLADLLSTIQRHRLVRELDLNGQRSTTRSLIPPYRKLLYDLSDDITKEDLRQIKFLLRDSLPRKKLEENVTTLEVFQEMEHKDLLSNTNLNLLENIIENVCPMLKRRIDQFKAERVTHRGPVTQETGAGLYRQRSASGSDVFKLYQAATSRPERPASFGSPADLNAYANAGECLMPPSFFSGSLQPSAEYRSMNPSNTSLDVPRVSDITDEDLSHRLSLLDTKPSTPAAPREKSHTVETSSSSGNKTSGPLQSQEEVLGSYAMTGTQRGVCLIVNNYDFRGSTTQLNNRTGTHVDEESLTSVFKWLGFDVQIERDCTGDEMLSVVQELHQRDHSLMDCLVCCVLSHGQEGSVYGVDGQQVQLKQLTEPFSGRQCASLTEKPKLFFIQACQGTREQQVVQVQADSPAPGSLCTDARVPKDRLQSIPSGADLLMGMATVPHFASFRDRKLGTWFIQSLCQNLVKMVPGGYDLVSILTKVNDDVSKKTDFKGEKKQMPQPTLTLRKRVVFPVPKDRPPSLI